MVTPAAAIAQELDMMTRIPVYYSPRMVADALAYSLSPRKPAWVVERWLERRLPVDLLAVEPVDAPMLKRVHDATMVDEVLAGLRANGFGNRRQEVADSLPYTSGSMVQAAVEALRNGTVAVSTTSGFHHAGYAFSGGFCTFNGLALAAVVLHEDHGVEHVGVLDLDEHYGNGTDDIIRTLRLDWLDHYTGGAHALQPENAERFLEALPGIIEGMHARGCGVLLYQAGADAHVNDPLGGFLDDAQLERRDRIVFETCRRLQLPVAWNLAGGYRVDGAGHPSPVLDVHERTMQACVDTFVAAA